MFLAVDSEVGRGAGAWPPVMSALFDYTRVQDRPEASIEFVDTRVPRLPGCGYREGLASDYLVHFAPGPEPARRCHAQWTRFLVSAPKGFADSRSELAAFPLPNGGTGFA